MPPHETRIRVRYAETDQMGVVYYANYLVWMEVGRVEYCKACGFEYKQMELEDGVFLAVAEARCRYASPARFDEEVVIRTWVEEANPRMVLYTVGKRYRKGDRVAERLRTLAEAPAAERVALLVRESKYGMGTAELVARTLIGYGYIAGEHAEALQKFYTAYLNPYLNYHRPCGFATVSLDARGKRQR